MISPVATARFVAPLLLAFGTLLFASPFALAEELKTPFQLPPLVPDELSCSPMSRSGIQRDAGAYITRLQKHASEYVPTAPQTLASYFIVTVNTSGQLQDIKVLQSTGNVKTDQKRMKKIRKAFPGGPLPTGLPSLSFIIPGQNLKPLPQHVLSPIGPWLGSFQKSIRNVWNPPKGKSSNAVEMLFDMDPENGDILAYRIKQSSCTEGFDEAALNAARKADIARTSSRLINNPINIEFTFDYTVLKGPNKPPETSRPEKSSDANLPDLPAKQETPTPKPDIDLTPLARPIKPHYTPVPAPCQGSVASVRSYIVQQQDKISALFKEGDKGPAPLLLITVAHSGAVENVRVVTSSGSKDNDESIIQKVLTAFPGPTLPAGLSRLTFVASGFHATKTRQSSEEQQEEMKRWVSAFQKRIQQNWKAPIVTDKSTNASTVAMMDIEPVSGEIINYYLTHSSCTANFDAGALKSIPIYNLAPTPTPTWLQSDLVNMEFTYTLNLMKR